MLADENRPIGPVMVNLCWW